LRLKIIKITLQIGRAQIKIVALELEIYHGAIPLKYIWYNSKLMRKINALVDLKSMNLIRQLN
jgi:hypothetical protein